MRAFLGLGANLGNRKQNLQSALSMLARPGLAIRQISSVYETEPIGLLEQPWFLNLVAEVETDLPPLPLLDVCQQVELALGRERTILNGPRTIDIDILLYGETVLSTGRLTLPHPRYLDRRFTLQPLTEIAPLLRDPVTGQPVVELLAKLHDQPVRLSSVRVCL